MEPRKRDGDRGGGPGGGPRRERGGGGPGGQYRGPRGGPGGGQGGQYRGPRGGPGGGQGGQYRGGPGGGQGGQYRGGPGGGPRRGPPVGTGPKGIFYVRNSQPMYTALEVLERLGAEGRLKLKARGESIPTAVAVANIVTERLIKGSSKIEGVRVDSEEIKSLGGVQSTIEITLSKSGAGPAEAAGQAP